LRTYRDKKQTEEEGKERSDLNPVPIKTPAKPIKRSAERKLRLEGDRTLVSQMTLLTSIREGSKGITLQFGVARNSEGHPSRQITVFKRG